MKLKRQSKESPKGMRWQTKLPWEEVQLIEKLKSTFEKNRKIKNSKTRKKASEI